MNQMSAKETVLQFCYCWFVERNQEETLTFLSEDVSFVGTGIDEQADGTVEMAAYLQQDISEIPEPFVMEMSALHERFLTDEIDMITTGLILKNSFYNWHLRAFFTLMKKDRGWQICSLHIAEPGSSQQGSEHYPQTLVLKNIAKKRMELLNDSIAGGMMGGYIAPGFPFYFINQRMLEYLGYESQEEFVDDIDGMITNCMHPDDRKQVDEQVEIQLAHGEEYVVEYRMKKKDGSYIWVHDVGRRMTSEDGRDAITSVCVDITAQREAQEEILHIYNNIPGAVFRCRYDNVFSVIEANDGLYDFIGYTREEFAELGNCMAAVTFQEDIERIQEDISAQLGDGNTIHIEQRLICRNDMVKWISVKAQLLTENDKKQYFYCVFVDITEEKQMQERIRELYEQELAYFTELSSVNGCIRGRINVTQGRVESYVATPETTISRVGASYEEIMEALARSAVEPESERKLREMLVRSTVIDNYTVGKVDYSCDFLRKRTDGSVFWSNTNFRAHLNPETGDIILFTYTFDMTEQKLKEQLLFRIMELDYDILIDIDMIHDTHRLLTIHETAGSAIPVEGSFQEEIRRAAERFQEESSKQTYLEKLSYEYMVKELETQESYSFMVEDRDKNGGLLVKRFEVFYIDKNLGRVCLARTDVTDVVLQEQKQKTEIAAALVAAEQANAAKTDFLSRMSHEIRTPMNAIIGMSTIAAQSIGDDEQVGDCISKIGISSRFLLSLINDILDMSRIESGKMLLKNEKIPTEEFLNGINSICYGQAAAKRVDYECIVDPVLDDYYIGDAMKLQQVLINILSNAIKFTGEGGKVTFSASQHRRTKNDAVLRFIINDTGVGMNEDFMPHIFEPFSQESTGTTALYGGTGLGLAISKSIVDMMDGKITVRSIKGIGSEFTVDVKLGITEEEKLRHNQKKANYNFSHLKTLVVDDDVAVCESAIVTLREMGVTAEWVDSGRKAIDRVKILWGAGKYFDMILIDWKMPEMDGLETARRIRNIVGPEVTIIIMTAYDWLSIEHEAKLAGVNLLMSKPMFKSSLISAFSRVLGQKEEKMTESEAFDYNFEGKRVLLVEDHPLNIEIAVMLLKGKGLLVDTAENGLRALELFSKSVEGYYDAILMDIRMPLMDGLTAATNIRHLSNRDAKTVPIIAMTANAFDDDIEKSKAAGMNAHLAKPIEPERLYQTLYDFIFGKEADEDEWFQRNI